MDANGAWWWYENKPIIWNSKYSYEWQPNGNSQMAMVGLPWSHTLEERPVDVLDENARLRKLLSDCLDCFEDTPERPIVIAIKKALEDKKNEQA
jgi:hypothetical protein